MSKVKLLKAVAAAVCLLASTTGHAALYTNSLGTLVIPPSDDGSFGAVNLGFSVNYFGSSYSSIYINNNGNITFVNGSSAYSSIPQDGQQIGPMIAPYWTDLISTDSPYADSGVYLQQSANQTVVTWNNMGYFSSNYSGTVTFQLVLNDPATVESAVGFYYGDMSAGTDAHPVSIGFGDGLPSFNSGESSTYLVSSNAAAQLNQSTGFYSLPGGIPLAVPEPDTYAMMLAGLAGLGFVGRRRRVV